MAVGTHFALRYHLPVLRRLLPWVFLTLPLWSVGYLLIHLAQARAFFGHIPQYLVDRDWFHTEVELFAHAVWPFLYLLADVLFIPWVIIALILILRRTHRGTSVACIILFLLAAASFFSLIFLDHTGFIGWLTD